MTNDEFFEAMYRRAARSPAAIPWASLRPGQMVERWLASATGTPGSAVVVACGLGDDAEALAAHGWQVTAFDISPTAIEWAKERFPNSPVEYTVADLFTLPPDWSESFSLVVEALTIQSISPSVRNEVCRAIADLVVPGGTLLVAAVGHNGPRVESGPPWPLLREDLQAMEVAGLEEVAFRTQPSPWEGFEHFEVEYVRPPLPHLAGR